MNEKIEQLAMERDFDALTESEQQWVQSEMSPEAYTLLRQVLRGAPQLDARASPPPALRARLLQQVKPAPHPLLWPAALAALFLGVILGWHLKPADPAPHPVQVVVIDTVWQEKIVWRDRLVRSKPAMAPPAAQRVFRTGVVPDSLPAATGPAVQLLERNHVGTSLDDTPELLDFFTKAQ